MPRIKIKKSSVDALDVTGKRYTATDTEIAGFCVRVSAAGRKDYGYRYRAGGGRNGRPRWYSIGTHGAITPDQAREIARSLAADVARGGDPAADRQAHREAPTVGELLDLYLVDHVQKKNKPATAKNVRLLIEGVIRPRLGTLKVADLTVGDVARFHNANSGTPYQANRALAALSKALSMAEIWGYRPAGTNPCPKVERFRERSRERFLSVAEFQRLGEVLAEAERAPLVLVGRDGRQRLRRVNPEAIRAFRLLIFTGARVGEVLSLRWEYIDLASGRARLPDSKTGAKVLQLPPPALEVLNGVLADDRPATGYVLRGGKGEDAERGLVNLKGPWSVVREAAGLDDVRLHDLRHAFASVAVERGLSLAMIGKLLGHRETRTTARYAHLADDPQRAAATDVASQIAMAMRNEGGVVISLKKGGG
jgi:integrase